MIAVLDEADMVVIAASALNMDPTQVLDRADVAVLTAVVRRTARADTLAEAAAEVLVGVAASRPFPRDNAAAAWLAVNQLLALNGAKLDLNEADATALVVGAADGVVDEAQAARNLAEHLRRRPGVARRTLTRLTAACRARSGPSTWPCPECSRDVAWPIQPWVVGRPIRRELAALCQRQHRAPHHSQPPSAGTAPEPGPSWCPVVSGPRDDEGQGLAVLGPNAAVVLLPSDAGPDSFELVVLPALEATDLVGSWRRLRERGQVAGRVEAAELRMDPSRSMLDWDHLVCSTVGAAAGLR